MTEVRTAIAIRIPRPWHTEAEFIEHEVETISRTGILLLGTHSRPQGTILRFEVTLAGGQPMVRGEGRVVSYNQVAFRGEPGLLLRFTRLDPRSKELVDRVAAIRRQEGMMSMAPPTSMSEAPKAQESVSLSSTGEIGVLSSKLIVAASAFPLPMEPAHDATIAPPPAPPTEAPPPAMATMMAPPLFSRDRPGHMPPSTSPPERASSPPPSTGPRSAPPPPPSGAPRSRRSVPPPLPAAARRSSPPSARSSAPPPPPPSALASASPFEALREQVESRMSRRPATPPPPPVVEVEIDVDMDADVEAPATLSPSPPEAQADELAADTQDVEAVPHAPPAPERLAAPPSAMIAPPPAVAAPVVMTATSATPKRTLTAPPDREDLLRRLRTRASAMPAADRAKILTPRAR